MNFSLIAKRSSEFLGSPKAFSGSVLLILLWAIVGPFIGFSATWQLTINTVTTIITFLAVFLIQHAQNADTKAIHIKLDELIDKTDADSEFMQIERDNHERLEELDQQHSRPIPPQGQEEVVPKTPGGYGATR
jgi:low affinity Fe/Cu permease